MKGFKITFLVLIVFAFLSIPADAQRKMEELDRGLVAVQVNNGVFLSWRIMGYEWEGVNYNIYRDGTKLNTEPLTISNYEDANGAESSTYTVSAIVDGVEQAQCDAVSPLAQQYKNIVLKSRSTSDYEINDATAADLDGDGEYEIIVKRLNKDYSTGNTNYSFFEAYKMDGTLMWEINVGPNILSSSGVEINIAAFDLNEDGKAEVFMRTSEGTIFGDGTKIGDTNNDGTLNYRYSVNQTANMQYLTEGPEFLSLIDGMSGAELDRVNFIPRINAEWWGDGYGHRANKFFFGAPYLDGKHPSLFIGRGIYTKTVMRTYDLTEDMKLQQRWEFRAESGAYYGQGNHNYTVADVDEDGRDEIVWGSMTVDDNGKGLYSTEMGHGDALHVGDLDPFRKGTEIWKCLEESPVFGTILYDGATGEILIHDKLNRDCGRCMAANISNAYPGAELWGSNNSYSASTLNEINAGGSVNYRIYWDGDLLDELLDHTGFNSNPGYGTGSISKLGKGNILVANGTASCNYTKGTPSLQADLFGDWREEVVWRNTANTAIRIYTTVDPTQYRIYTLMHDHQYRQAICWQMCGYNQPPHVSYFVGEKEGLTVPPPPTISNKKLVYTGTGEWNASNTNFNLDGTDQAYADGSEVLFDVTSGESVSLVTSVEPKTVTINSPKDFSIDGTAGVFGGEMKLIKQGKGNLKLTGTHNYSSETKVWNGSLELEGTLVNSAVKLGLFGKLLAKGELKNGLAMRRSSVLEIGNGEGTSTLKVSGEVTLESKAVIGFDLFAPESDQNDSLIIDGNLTFGDHIIFKIKSHLAEGKEKLEAGKYLLASVSGGVNGTLQNVDVEGIAGTPVELVQEDKNIYLIIKSVRAASSVVWNGSATSPNWDLANSASFLNEGTPDVFVDQDEVVFNDNAETKLVNITSEVTPSAVAINADENYIFKGDGKISGDGTFTKNGAGKVLVYNQNDFTGKITINEGEVIVSNLSNSQQQGGLGVVNSNTSNFVINGGQLTINDSGSAEQGISIGSNGATISNTKGLEWKASFSGGTLNLSGAGEMVLANSNSHARTNLLAGSLKLLSDNANPGRVVSIRNGATLQCSDNSYSYNTMNWDIEVPTNETGSINMDGRGYYTGKILGGGTLNMYIPFVRTDLNGDMTGFTGRLNVSGRDLRINNSKGIPNALLNIESGVYTSNESGSTIYIGALMGQGTLGGNENYVIGSKNIDSEFDGEIINGSLRKVGSGVLKLSNANTYNGGTSIASGTLFASNKSGSATGTGSVSVQNNGTLTGTGNIAGAVSVASGGTLKPGTNAVGTSISFDKNVSLASGSVYEVITNPIFKYSNYLSTNGTVLIAGALHITNKTTAEYKIGDEYKLFEASKIIGAFETIVPWKPGEGLSWDLSELESRGVIKVALSNSTEELATPKAIVYPNPVQDVLYLNIENRNQKKLNVSISDFTGRKWESVSINSDQSKLEVNHLPQGVYFITVESDRIIFQSKFVKQ